MKRGLCIPLLLAVACLVVALAVTLPIVLTRNKEITNQVQSGATASDGEEGLDKAPGEKLSLAPSSQVPTAPTYVPLTQPTPTAPIPTFALIEPQTTPIPTFAPTDPPSTPIPTFAPTGTPTRARPDFEALLAAAPMLSLPDTSGEGCERLYGCRKDWGGDRMGHDAAFRPGEAICSRQGAQYMLGLDEDGRFLWSDCTTGEERVYFSPDGGVDVALFVMRDDASFEIYDAAGTVVWRAECDCKDQVMFYSQCLSSQNLDCPYIHLRKGSKAMLNYIDFNYQWITADIHKHYNY